MRNIIDCIKLPKEFPFEIFRIKPMEVAPFMVHRHDCLEINYILSGKGVNIIGENCYSVSPGEIYIMNNNEYHYSFSEDSLELLSIIFEPLFVSLNNPFDYGYLNPFGDKKECFCNKVERSSEVAEKIENLMFEIEEEYNNKKVGYQLIIKALLMKILGLLHRHLKIEGKFSVDYLQRQKGIERINSALGYLNENFSSEINLKELSEKVFMSPTYFSSYFKKVMNMNVTDYILTLRVNHAAKLLGNTTKSIAEISDECGFSSLSYFSRTFKAYTNISPGEYRRR